MSPIDQRPHSTHQSGNQEGARVMGGKTVNPLPPVLSVVINEVTLSEVDLRALEEMSHMHIPDGRYWYDPVSGACGLEGGPAITFAQPGLNLGGPLRADASRGQMGVFINGRELHELDVAALSKFTPVYPGRYRVDAWGNGGYEGGPAFFNLVRLAQAAQQGGVGGGHSSALST